MKNCKILILFFLVFLTKAFALNPTDIENNEIDKDPTNPSQNEYVYSTWTGSLMFTDTVITSLKQSVSKYLMIKHSNNTKNNQDTDSLANLTNDQKIYLNSLLYYSKDDWIIWLNKKKFTAKNKNEIKFFIPGLEVINITNQEVSFQYFLGSLDLFIPNWRDNINKTNENSTFSSATNNIMLKEEDNSIIFTLRPNQTFVFNKMDIEEGNLSNKQQTTIRNKQ